MAQALLNSLNNLKDSGIFSANLPVSENIENSNFETILDAQTENLEEMTELAIETIGSIKDELAQEVQTLGSIIKDTIAEIGAENALDLTLDEISEQITEEEYPTETEIGTETETQSETENSEENNSTITNEEPTMQKEILENPTAGLILTSQTQLNQPSSMLKEENETTSQNANSDIKFVSTNKNDTNFNTTSGKDVLTYSDAASKADNTPPSKVQNIIDDKMAEKLNIETVETEGGNNNNQSSHDLMQNQTPEEQGVKAVIQGEVKYEEISSKQIQQTVQTQAKSITQDTSASKIIDQIAKQMNSINSNSKVNIVLNPESLGKVILQLVNSKDGLTAMFTVTNQDTKNLLSNGLDGLKDTLLSQGVSVDNISIKLTETESEYNPDWTEQEGSRGGNKGGQNKRNKENQKAFEQTMFEINNKQEENV